MQTTTTRSVPVPYGSTYNSHGYDPMTSMPRHGSFENVSGEAQHHDGARHGDDSSEFASQSSASPETRRERAQQREHKARFNGGSSGFSVGHSNLYVKNISDRIDELMLRELFEACGTVQSCCVIRDVTTNKSRGFGFVKFCSVERATEAIERFNGKEFAGKTLEVKFANTGGENDDFNGQNSNAPPSDNIYVKGLPPNWTQDELKSYFSEFGHIVECRLLHANKSTSSGALIRFLRGSEATAAVEKASGRTLLGVATPLVVRYAEPQGKSKRVGQSSPPSATSFMPIHGLMAREDSAYNENEFGDMFSTMGLKSISSNSGLSELLNTFENEDDFAAVAALGSSPSHKFAAAPQMQSSLAWTSAFSAASRAPPRATALAVQNLPITADELLLYKIFAPFGAVLSTRIIRDKWTGLCNGSGVVNFRSDFEAMTAQSALHMTPTGNNTLLSVTTMLNR